MPKHPLEKLLQEHCPQGVEFLPLKEVCALRTGERITTKEMRANAPYPVWGGGVQPTGRYHAYNFEEAITIARAGSAGHVGFQVGKFWATDVCFVASKKEDMPALIKFVFYVLQSNQNKLRANLYGATMPKLDKGVLYDFPIPLPPLIVQEKIVTILDCFTELTAELTARKKQYSYYLNALLDFGRDPSGGGGVTRESYDFTHALLKKSFKVEWVELGEATHRVANVKWKDNNSNYAYIDLASVDRELSKITQTTPINAKNAPSRARYIVKTKDVLLGTTRPLLKRYTLVEPQHNGQICSTGFCVLRADTTKVLPEWIFYNIASRRFLNHAQAWQEGTSYPMLADKHVMSFTIPLPPLVVQEKIIEILDQFHTLTTDLQQGLPAEIEAREKQYTHYLNALLNFSTTS
ncbi:restriction endonuclease subunit S [Helicobacter vulpis]|uniref:restriction endonuclease subunit S n=1 Tax=Helicobacter vulpis TaxID=2316076 RepID=UPI000EB41E9D|nr:restriction endonuclease subunit S [Helicobacter vulpis]